VLEAAEFRHFFVFRNIVQ